MMKNYIFILLLAVVGIFFTSSQFYEPVDTGGLTTLNLQDIADEVESIKAETVGVCPAPTIQKNNPMGVLYSSSYVEYDTYVYSGHGETARLSGRFVYPVTVNSITNLKTK